MALSAKSKSTIVMGFWLAFGFAVFAFVLAMVKKFANKAKTDLTAQPKRDYVN